MSPSNGGRILIVDDQKNWRELLQILLEKDGFVVTAVDGFDECKSILEKIFFDLVVLDLRLIDQDTFNVEGLALLQEIRTKSPATKAIILTGYPDSIKSETGADAVILKVPYEKTFDKMAFRKLVQELFTSSKD